MYLTILNLSEEVVVILYRTILYHTYVERIIVVEVRAAEQSWEQLAVQRWHAYDEILLGLGEKNIKL